MDKWFRPTLYMACDYLYVLEFKSIHVTKRVLWSFINCYWVDVDGGTYVIGLSKPVPAGSVGDVYWQKDGNCACINIITLHLT